MIQDKTVCAVVVAAGKSTRMGFDKLFHPIAGAPVLRHAVARLDAHPAVDRLVVVAGENIGQVRGLFEADPTCKPLDIVAGGEARADSVLAGLAACGGADIVAIHDAARPFIPAEVLDAVFAATVATGAAAPALPVKDTMKKEAGGLITATVPREDLWAVQTPQCFARAAFEEAFAAIPPGERAALTDDCQVFERAGLPVALVHGDEMNRKITTPEDLAVMEQMMAQPPAQRVGHGYDVHKLVEGRLLVIGGVTVPFEKGLLGHSDADVLLHAVSDALLGACALGDIGRHFPDTDPAYKGADSLVLLKEVAAILRREGFEPQNVDATLLCQRPKLAPFIPAMRANIAGALGLGEGAVSVKATTEEGLGFTGAGQGIAAHCVTTVRQAAL